MFPTFRAAAFAGLMMAAAPLAQAQAPQFSPEQRRAIGEGVKEYLLQNPEVLQEAIVELERRQQEAQKVAQASALKDSREALVNSPHGNLVGNPQGDVTLVEFFDYNCGYCKRALSDMTALIEANPDLKVVMKEFPILTEGSVEAARISVAVKEKAPDRYLDFHQQLLTRPGEATGGKALDIARELGLDT